MSWFPHCYKLIRKYRIQFLQGTIMIVYFLGGNCSFPNYENSLSAVATSREAPKVTWLYLDQNISNTICRIFVENLELKKNLTYYYYYMKMLTNVAVILSGRIYCAYLLILVLKWWLKSTVQSLHMIFFCCQHNFSHCMYTSKVNQSKTLFQQSFDTFWKLSS